MDFLDRLQLLMNAKNINKKELAQQAKIPASTVYSWWAKGYEGITLPTINKLCAFFHCSMDWLVCGEEGNEALSENEVKLIHAFRAADDRAREDALDTLLAHPRAKTEENLA